MYQLCVIILSIKVTVCVIAIFYHRCTNYVYEGKWSIPSNYTSAKYRLHWVSAGLLAIVRVEGRRQLPLSLPVGHHSQAGGSRRPEVLLVASIRPSGGRFLCLMHRAGGKVSQGTVSAIDHFPERNGTSNSARNGKGTERRTVHGTARERNVEQCT